MRLVAVALLFVTALDAQRGMGGFGRHPGFRAPGGFRGGFGFHAPRPPSHGFIGRGYSRGGFGFRYGRSVYGGIWGGSYFPFGWYSAPLWTGPVAYPGWAPYAYNTSPTINIVTVPAATIEPSHTVELNHSTYRRPSAPEPAPERAENPPLATQSWAYIIAARDGTIWLAREYRVEGGILHFTTVTDKAGDNWKRVPLADVNGPLTEKLNRERGVAVDLR
jgi:hypothetical protein